MSIISNQFQKRLHQKYISEHSITPPQGFTKFQKIDTEQSITSRFEQQVNKFPQKIAIKTTNTTITYEQLNKAANFFAHSLLSQYGKKQEVIALLLEKGASFISVIFGVLKTGKILVPLDPSFPVDRLAHILADSQASVIITNNQNLDLAQKLATQDCQLFNIDTICNNSYTQNPHVNISSDRPAYIIYTSGSTGKPKGVVQSHRNSLHYCMNDTNTLLISPEDRVVFLYSCSTLGGILCIFYTLLNGASLYSFDVKEAGLSNLVSWLIEEKITIYHSFATLFRNFLDILIGTERFPSIRLVKLGGEATLQRDVVAYKQYFSDHCILYASLGATETGNFCNFIVTKNTLITSSTVPIGYPVEDMEIMLLDETGREVECGSVGEIAVKSKYLALGYWQLPELTTSVFLTVSQDGQERIYRTGDLGCIQPDGCLIHMGRKDFQVKIRGFRIELAEIEMALFQTGTLKTVVVTAYEDMHAEKRLIAYLVSKQQPVPTIKELRHYLRDKLPDYMIPSAFVFLDALPLTPNGKVDRRSLPAPNLAQLAMGDTFVAPQDDLERQLTQIWETALGIQPIGVRDNFFDLGGDSLLAVRLFAEIERKFGKKLPLAALFPSGTIEAIAQIIHQEQLLTCENVLANLSITAFPPDQPSSLWSPLVKIQPHGSKPPLFLIHSLGGEVLCYQKFVTHLGTEQPVYGLQPQGLDGKQPPLLGVRDIAAYYIQEIQTIQPQGPYFLAGYSFGGLVAFEMAQQLHQQGEELGILGIFDTCRPGYSHRLPLFKRIPLHLTNLLHQKNNYIQHKARGLSQVLKHQLKRKYKLSAETTALALNLTAKSPETEKYLDVMTANTQAMNSYTFQPYPGKAILFRTEDQNRSDAIGVEYDPQFGWGDVVTGGLDVHYIPGSHISLLNEPHVKTLAEKFQLCLEKAHINYSK